MMRCWRLNLLLVFRSVRFALTAFFVIFVSLLDVKWVHKVVDRGILYRCLVMIKYMLVTLWVTGVSTTIQ